MYQLTAGLQRRDSPTASPLAGPQPKPASCADSNLSRPVTHQSESPLDTEAKTGGRGEGREIVKCQREESGNVVKMAERKGDKWNDRRMRGARGEEEDREREESEAES